MTNTALIFQPSTLYLQLNNLMSKKVIILDSFKNDFIGF